MLGVFAWVMFGAYVVVVGGIVGCFAVAVLKDS